jgi:hypothetical protein
MPSDVSIGAIASPSTLPSTAGTNLVRTSTAPATATPAAATAAGNPNPTLRLDPALGLVVIEFVSKSGAVTTSIPTQRELAAYQNGTAQPPGTERSKSA